MIDTWLYYGLFPFLVCLCVAYICEMEQWDKLPKWWKDDIPFYVELLFTTGCVVSFVSFFVFLIGAVIAIQGDHGRALLVLQGVLTFEVWSVVGVWLSHTHYLKAKESSKGSSIKDKR